MIDMKQLVAQWNTEFMYLVPFLKSTLESGLAYDMLKETFERIPLVNRIIPAKNIAVPCLEGIVLNTDNEILQNNFIALLEKSMDSSKQDLCHPSFPKILSQLSVDELIFLYYLGIGNLKPYLRVMLLPIQLHNIIAKKSQERRKLYSYLTFSDNYRVYSSHLESLNLIDYYHDSDTMKFTEFSKQFFKACFSEKAEKLIEDIIENKEKNNVIK